MFNECSVFNELHTFKLVCGLPEFVVVVREHRNDGAQDRKGV